MNAAENSTKKVIVRYPPSPTGKLHIGNVRTLVFNYLFAKKHDGKIIYRAEDTDRERSQLEYEDYAVESFNWLGLEFHERYRQSDRLDVYKSYLNRLIEEGKAYVSEETPTDEQIARAKEEGRELRTSVIRLKNPGTKVTFSDIVLGEVTTDTTDLGDFIIAKDMETPLYHLTVVIDDHEMEVTHIIRGMDHVANTARQILIQEAIGANRPEYAHVPLVVGTDGQKLSKRHGATATLDYRDQGYLADAMINFLAFVGWNPGNEQEIFTREQLIQEFSLERVQKSSAVFNTDKLNWINREHIRLLSPQDLQSDLEPFTAELRNLPNYSEEVFQKILPLITERIYNFGELQNLIAEGDFVYFFQQPKYQVENLIWKKGTKEDTIKHLEAVVAMVSNVTDWTADGIKSTIWDYAEEHGRGDVLWPLRYALSGRDKSPDPFTLAAVLGPDTTKQRIKVALDQLE